jgi:hypothetical protein
MGRAAGQDEDGEKLDRPGEDEIPPPQRDDHQDDGDGPIGEARQRIGDEVQPDQLGAPQQANPMRGEGIVLKEYCQIGHGFCTTVQYGLLDRLRLLEPGMWVQP